MEIYKTTFKGSEVSVIFTGSHYYFHNSYYGVIAVAERDYNETKYNWDEPHKTHFVVTTGNSRCTGGSLCGSVVSSLVKKFIRKADQKYSEVCISFEDRESDLSQGFLSCEFISR